MESFPYIYMVDRIIIGPDNSTAKDLPTEKLHAMDHQENARQITSLHI